jgi:hypothetical protein
MSNVIDFTKFKVDKETERFDQLVEESEAIDDFSADFAFSVAADIAVALSELDYDVMDDPKCILEILTLVEVVRAMIFRITGMEYPFHRVSESLFQDIFDKQGGDYRTALSNFLAEIVD